MSRLTTVYVRWQRFQEQLPEPDAAWHPGEFCHQHGAPIGHPDYRVFRCEYTEAGACNPNCRLFNGSDQRVVMDTLELIMNQKEL